MTSWVWSLVQILRRRLSLDASARGAPELSLGGYAGEPGEVVHKMQYMKEQWLGQRAEGRRP